MSSKNKAALIMVDLQNDFCRGGSLEVPDADAVIPLANQLQKQFDLVIATKDWHPKDHMSFASNNPGSHRGEIITVNNMVQILWPDHCVQETKGAEFHPELDVSLVQHIAFKGTDKTIDSYSAFFDNAHLRETGLGEYLKQHHVKEIYVMGLATDYCVKYSCIDGMHLGFDVHLIEDACRGVELVPGDIEKAIKEMREVGVKITESKSVLVSC